MTLATLFLIAALICFGLAAFGVATGRVSLVPLGLGLWVCALLFGATRIG